MARTKAADWAVWLGGLGFDLAGLTGSDSATLAAIDKLWAVYPVCDHPDRVIVAVTALLPCMQGKYWPLARELIPKAMDWSDRERIWPKVLKGIAGDTDWSTPTHIMVRLRKMVEGDND